MKLSIKAGSTSQSCNVFIQNNTVTTGIGLTGLAYNTASLTAYYSFTGAAAASTVLTLTTLATLATAWQTGGGGFIEIDNSKMKGWYRLDIPNAVLAAGNGRSVSIHLQGAASMADTPIEIELTAWDNQDAVHGGLSALPNTAVTTNGSLLTAGTGTSQITTDGSGRVDVGTWLDHAVTVDSNNYPNISAKYWAGTAITATSIPVATAAGAAGGLIISGSNSGTTTFAALTVTGATTLTGAVSLGSTLGVTGTVTLAALTVSGATTLTGAVSLGSTLAVTGTTTFTGVVTATAGVVSNVITGSLSGAVGSVTGAVGSISGITFPTNFAAFVIDASGRIDIGKILGTASAGTAGYVGPDWGHVNAPTTTVGLSGTTISTGQVVASVSGAAGSVTGNVGGSVGSVTGAVGSVTGAVGSVVGNVGGSVASVVGAVGSVLNTPFKINTASAFSVFLVSSTDNKSPYTGGSVSCTRSINGATPVAITGSVTQIGATNEYYMSGAAADFNGATVSFIFTATGANPVYVSINPFL